jgi:hypothetical protein
MAESVTAFRTVNLPAVTTTALAASAGLIFFWPAPPLPAQAVGGPVQAAATVPTPAVVAAQYVDLIPNPVVGTATVPGPTITQDVNVTPSAVNQSSTVGPPAISATGVSAVAQAGLLFFWSGSASPDASITTSELAPFATVPTLTVVADANITLAVLSRPSTVNTPTVTTTISPVVARAATVPTPGISISAGAVAQAGLIFLWSAGPGSEVIIVGPVARAATVPTPGIGALDVNITVGQVIGTRTVPTPTLNTDLNAFDDAFQDDTFQEPGAHPIVVTVGPVIGTRNIPLPSISTGPNASLTAGPVIAAATVPTPTVNVSINLTPAAVGRAATIPLPAIDTGGSASVTAGVTRSATVPLPTITGAVIVVTTSRVLVALTGKVYVAPVGTTAPVDSTAALNAAFTELGFITEGGVRIHENRERASVARWNTPDLSRTIITARALAVSTSLREWNRRTIQLALGGTVSGSAGDYSFIPPDVTTDEAKAFVLEWSDSTKHYRLYIPTGRTTDAVESSLSRTGAADLPLTFVANSTGEPTYTLFTDDPSFA